MAEAPQAGLIAALARCQAKFPPIVKSHTNPAFKGSQYADVADVLAAVRPVLAAEGIVVTQVTQVDNETGAVTLITRLLYGPDGEQLSSVFPLYVSGLTDQQVGSKLTYTKRYQLCAILGVHPVGDDDDGNLAATAPARTQATTTPTTASVPDDWESRPLLSMTFTELRGVAEKVGHAFSGGTKAELIRTLQPVMDARTGAEPFVVDVGNGVVSGNIGGQPPEPEPIPFSPVVAKPHTTATERAHRDQVEADIREGR